MSNNIGLAQNKKLEPFMKPDVETLKQQLSDLQYKVTQENGTETAFQNKYWSHKEAGIYVDIVSNEILFSSLDKYNSGTGWPSFTKPLEVKNIITLTDKSWFGVRIEVRSKNADSHLGHVFDDEPHPTRKRYCINSAALKFIPVSEFKKEGLEQYLPLFKTDS